MSASFLAAVKARALDANNLDSCIVSLTSVPKDLLELVPISMTAACRLAQVCWHLNTMLDDHFWRCCYDRRWDSCGMLEAQGEQGATARRRCVIRDAAERACTQQLYAAAKISEGLAAHFKQMVASGAPLPEGSSPGESHSTFVRNILSLSVYNRLDDLNRGRSGLRGMRFEEFSLALGRHVLEGVLFPVIRQQAGPAASKPQPLLLRIEITVHAAPGVEAPELDGMDQRDASRVRYGGRVRLTGRVTTSAGDIQMYRSYAPESSDAATTVSAQETSVEQYCFGGKIYGHPRGTQMQWWARPDGSIGQRCLFFHSLVDVEGRKICGQVYDRRWETQHVAAMPLTSEENEWASFVLFTQSR